MRLGGPDNLVRPFQDLHSTPTWVDLLDEASARTANVPHSTDPAQPVVQKTITNRTKWSTLGWHLLARLNAPIPLLPFAARDCLSLDQTAMLAEVAFDAPAGIFNRDQVAKLRRRNWPDT